MFANFGGVPLAFLFIATIGSSGLVGQWLDHASGFDPYAHGFTLYSLTGVVIVYLYFQIPLMVLVILPPWRACARRGGSRREPGRAQPADYWRHVGGPVLLPSFLGLRAAAVRQLPCPPTPPPRP